MSRSNKKKVAKPLKLNHEQTPISHVKGANAFPLPRDISMRVMSADDLASTAKVAVVVQDDYQDKPIAIVPVFNAASPTDVDVTDHAFLRHVWQQRLNYQAFVFARGNEMYAQYVITTQRLVTAARTLENILTHLQNSYSPDEITNALAEFALADEEWEDIEATRIAVLNGSISNKHPSAK